MKHLNIGLFGFGVVGEGIYKVLNEKPNLNLAIRKIVVKDAQKQRNAPDDLFTVNPDEVLLDNSIDVVVELIDDAKAAFAIVTQAMKSGKSVVSANKKMIAENLEYLLGLQEACGVSFLYEGAVCGSVPVLRNLEEYFDNDLLHYVRGIVNGSTNYILTQMKQECRSYAHSLESAQQNGFAESDPTLDVEGVDAAYKLSILALHAFGRIIDPLAIPRKGITALTESDFQFAEEKGLVIKLIATGAVSETENGLSTHIFPTFLPKNQTLSLVDNEFNGVLIGSGLADEQFLYGKGAGRFPTSSAVLSDISALRFNYRYEFKKGKQTGPEARVQEKRKFYLAFNKGVAVDLNIFETIQERYESNSRQYVIGEINLNQLDNFDFWRQNDVSLVAFG